MKKGFFRGVEINGTVVAQWDDDKQCFSSLGKLGDGRCWGTSNVEELFQIERLFGCVWFLGEAIRS